MLESLWKDLALTARSLLRNPAFTAIVVLTLALGIGGTTTMFTAVNAAFLQSLPYPEAERLAMVWQTRPDNPKVRASMLDALDWQAQNRSFSNLVPFASSSLNVVSGSSAERLTAGYITPKFFATLGVSPRLGRTFTAEESVEGGPRLVVVGHEIWKKALGADPKALSRRLHLEGVDFQVIGVMPEGFSFPDDAAFWLPMDTNDGTDRSAHNYRVVARMKPGVTIEQAQADMEAINERLAQAYPDSNTGYGISVLSLRRDQLGTTGPVLLLLMGAVSLVLLIACVNVTNLLFARSITRHSEATLRLALGATRGALLRPYLLESLLLSLAGGVLGLVLAVAGGRVLAGLAPAGLIDPEKLRTDGSVLLFTFLVTLLVGLFCGFAPAWRASRQDLREALAAGGRSLLGAGRLGMNTLVAVEVALAFVLLVGAGLLLQSARRLEAVELGFRTHNVSVLRFFLGGFPGSHYGEESWRVGFLGQLLDRAAQIPGVRAAGLISQAPLSGGSFNGSLIVEDRSGQVIGEDDGLEAHYRLIGGDYFSALKIPVQKGRAFSRQDRSEAPLTAIVNERLAKNLAGFGDPLGLRVKIPGMDGVDEWATIVGIVGDVRHRGIARDPAPEIYFPYEQRPRRTWTMSLVVNSDPAPAALVPRFREEVRALDAGLPFEFDTLENLLDANLAQARFRAVLLACFAGTALILAGVGIFGVVSYAVGRRSREVGIRMALGADKDSVRNLMLRGGMVPVLAGLGAGTLGALALTRLLASLVFEVQVTDPVTFGGVAVLLGGIALAAIYLPARRATRVDPVEALRTE